MKFLILFIGSFAFGSCSASWQGLHNLFKRSEINGISDEEKELRECMEQEDKLLPNVATCAEQAVAQANNELSPESTDTERVCLTYSAVARCVSKDVAELCGAHLEEFFFEGMMKGLTRDFPDNCAEDVREIRKRESNIRGPNRSEREDPSDEEQKMIECLQDEERLLTFVSSCSEKTVEDLISGTVPMAAGSSLSDVTCIAFLNIARCVSKEVGDLCGSPVEEPFFQGMLEALREEDPRAAASPQCAAAVREIDQDNGIRRKRRHISNRLSFSKFLP